MPREGMDVPCVLFWRCGIQIGQNDLKHMKKSFQFFVGYTRQGFTAQLDANAHNIVYHAIGLGCQANAPGPPVTFYTPALHKAHALQPVQHANKGWAFYTHTKGKFLLQNFTP